MESYLWLVPLGFVVGAYGTLIGAGGGFVLVPFLLLLYPDISPEVITSISLAVVFFNALSGSVAYARMGRIDYRSGLLFSATTVPGAILGALATAYISRQVFNGVFGLLMIAGAIFLILRANRGSGGKPGKGRFCFSRTLVDADGAVHRFSYNPALGAGVSFFVGCLSSLLGIGGGIIHVPFLSQFLSFPVHIATATSQFMLAIMALAGTLVHIARGTFSQGAQETAFLAVGVLAGAQLGAKLSSRIRGGWILRGLAVAIGFVGVRILITSL